jgi:hypothetical protein
MKLSIWMESLFSHRGLRIRRSRRPCCQRTTLRRDLQRHGNQPLPAWVEILETRLLLAAAFGDQHTISTAANAAWSVFAADVDGDGDMDVLSASQLDDTIAWYENNGSRNFTPHTISTAAAGAQSVFVADVDGDLDVLSVSFADDKIAWYEYLGNDDPPTINLDVDANGEARTLTDGVLIIRYLFGVTGARLTDGALGTSALRTDPAEIIAFLDGFLPAAASASLVVLTQDVLLANYDDPAMHVGILGNFASSTLSATTSTSSPDSSSTSDSTTTQDVVLPPINPAPLLEPALTEEEPADELPTEDDTKIVAAGDTNLDAFFKDLDGSPTERSTGGVRAIVTNELTVSKDLLVLFPTSASCDWR